MQSLVRQRAHVSCAAIAASEDVLGWIVIACVATGLWWLCSNYPTSLPAWAPWDFSLSWYLAFGCSVWWYLRGVTRSAADDRPPAWRSAAFFGGLAITYAVLQTRFEYAAQHMFFLNRVQQIVTHDLGPVLIAVAWPGVAFRQGMPRWMARITDWPFVLRFVAPLRNPVVAGVLFVGLVGLWLLPALQFAAMLNATLYDVMNWSMFIDGVLFWTLVLDPRPSPPARISVVTRLLLAMAVMLPQAWYGAMITFMHQDLYAFYSWCGRFYPAIGPLQDQELGGLIIWFPGDMMSIFAVVVLLYRLLNPPDPR